MREAAGKSVVILSPPFQGCNTFTRFKKEIHIYFYFSAEKCVSRPPFVNKTQNYLILHQHFFQIEPFLIDPESKEESQIEQPPIHLSMNISE